MRVIDDDVPEVTVIFDNATYSVNEGSTATANVVLSADPKRTITIPIVTSDLGGAKSADYSGAPKSIVTS